MNHPEAGRFSACRFARKMERMDGRFLIVALVLGVPLAQPLLASAQEVTIYRCVGKAGALTLRDSPCAAGQEQDVLNMQRPKDPPPGRDARKVARDRPAAAPVREVQVIYRTQPRPMYECVDEQGRTYTSEDGYGNRRWVPLWTLGYPVWHHRGHGGISRPHDMGGGGDTAHRPSAYPVAIPGGGTWVSDRCYPLPREEICERLSDRRYEVIRRYNTAGPTQRRELDLEQRSIDARLANECGTP